MLAALKQYILIVRDDAAFQRFVSFVAKSANPELGATVMSLAQQLREKSRREGRREAEVRLLRRQLRLRFHELPERAEALPETSTPAERAEWSERLLVAPTLAEVFDAAWADDAR